MSDISLEKNFPGKTQLKFVITKYIFKIQRAETFKIQKYLFFYASLMERFSPSFSKNWNVVR
jgi:hypothetical protein